MTDGPDAGAPTHRLTQQYSQRLGTLTAAQLQAALDRFDLGELLDARPAPGGLFGQNVLLRTSNGGYVLRGAPHHDGQFAKERFFSRIVHERTPANAPWPFLIERSPELFGWSYALMPLLAGEHLSDAAVQRALTQDDRIGVARAMGEHLALLQTATWDAPGAYDYAADDLASLEGTFADWFVATTRDWLERCLKASSATTPTDVAWIESIIERASAALAVPFVPVLVHTDYAEGNVVAKRDGDGWRITGVFDLGEAYAGDGEYDLARPVCWYGRMSPQGLRAFIDAYAAHRPLRDGFAERLALYIVADRLIIWEYGQRNHVWFKDEMVFRAWAEPFTQVELT
jgi:hygromycin-B 7''-O-kinase